MQTLILMLNFTLMALVLGMYFTLFGSFEADILLHRHPSGLTRRPRLYMRKDWMWPFLQSQIIQPGLVTYQSQEWTSGKLLIYCTIPKHLCNIICTDYLMWVWMKEMKTVMKGVLASLCFHILKNMILTASVNIVI